MTFRVGMKVVRVGTYVNEAVRARIALTGLKVSSPDFGEICTIGSIAEWRGMTLLRFVEHNNSHLTHLFPIEPGFKAELFRPAVSPKAEISFTQGAPKDSERWDNRRRFNVPQSTPKHVWSAEAVSVRD